MGIVQKFKFYHTNKYMHNPESVLKNKTHKLQGILTYKRIADPRPDNQTL